MPVRPAVARVMCSGVGEQTVARMDLVAGLLSQRRGAAAPRSTTVTDGSIARSRRSANDYEFPTGRPVRQAPPITLTADVRRARQHPSPRPPGGYHRGRRLIRPSRSDAEFMQ